MDQNQSNKNVTLIKIDPWSVIKIILVVLAVGFLYLIKDVVAVFLLAVILALVITPIVDWLEKRKVPRVLGTLFIYLLLTSLFVVLIIFLIPVISHQAKQLVNQLPILANKFFELKVPYFEFDSISKLINNLFSQGSILAGKEIFSFFRSVVGTLFAFVTILVIAFYVTVEKRSINNFIRSVIPRRHHDHTFLLINSTQRRIGAWGRGLIILCLFVGLLSYIGLRVLGVNYALLLALIAGLTEVIPWFGPIIGAIPAVFLALTQSPVKALMVIVLYVLIQQIENHLLVPQVMKKTSGLNPLVVIIVVLIGGKIAGVVGLLLAVPITTILAILIRDYLRLKEMVEEKIKPAV